MTTYSVTYGMRITGAITGGPKAGQTIDNAHSEVMEARSVEDAVAKAESYRGIFAGSIGIYSRQWFDKKPAVAFGQEWKASKRGRGGFLFTYNLAVVNLS